MRLASKSLRSVAVIRHILAGDPYFHGIMCYTSQEAAFLASRGFDDLLIGYPAWNEQDIAAVARTTTAGTHITLMVDSTEHVEQIETVAARHGVRLPLCLEIDISMDLPGLHFGVWRSPVHTPEQARPLLARIMASPQVWLDGLMGYEAQIAGVGDNLPGHKARNALVQRLKRRSIREIAQRRAAWGNFNKVVLENYVYWLLSEACRRVPSLCKTVCNISARSIATIDEINYSHRLFTTPRMVRFQEMEYNIPVEHTVAVINEIQECIQQRQFQVHFPIECRFVHSNDIWLSPAYQRDSAYITVHMYRGMPYRSYFHFIEEIFKRYQGRPHWGKMHTRTARELAELYPRWHDFRRVRAALDPQGVFLNSYLRDLFDAAEPLPSIDIGIPGAVQDEHNPIV